VHDVLGDGVVVPTSLEPDEAIAGLYSVGASLTSVSPRGVEQYETAAYNIAGQVMADEALRNAAISCEPAGVTDDACATEAIEALGLKLWRRPLTDGELATLVGIARDAGAILGGFDQGLEFALAAMLQSPNFVYRVELGEPDPDHAGQMRFTDYEMAARLSFFLWNTTPDDELLAAAARGELTTDEGLAAQVDRLLEDERAREGVRNFFTEMLQLADLDELNKDPLVFPYMSADLGVAAREETLLGLDHLVFEEDGDYRDIFVTTHTYVDRRLAAIYGVPAPADEGFGEIDLPEDGGRRGLLGQVAFLAGQSHPASSSVTLRGIYIREVLLCTELLPPPANLNTAIPEASEEAPTMRERVAIHLEDPMCAGCHNVMDPLGLGLENFDGLGVWREQENGFDIDPSSDLDGEPFGDPWELAEVVREHPKVGPCLAETVYRYAAGHVVENGEEDAIAWHADGFAKDKHRVRGLIRDVALGRAFRQAGEVVQ
jgi:hypothetical protein